MQKDDIAKLRRKARATPCVWSQTVKALTWYVQVVKDIEDLQRETHEHESQYVKHMTALAQESDVP